MQVKKRILAAAMLSAFLVLGGSAFGEAANHRHLPEGPQGIKKISKIRKMSKMRKMRKMSKMRRIGRIVGIGGKRHRRRHQLR